MKKIKVKPAEGLTVLNPESHNPMGECEVERSPAIIRLLKTGDLVEVIAKKKQPKKQESK